MVNNRLLPNQTQLLVTDATIISNLKDRANWVDNSYVWPTTWLVENNIFYDKDTKILYVYDGLRVSRYMNKEWKVVETNSWVYNAGIRENIKVDTVWDAVIYLPDATLYKGEMISFRKDSNSDWAVAPLTYNNQPINWIIPIESLYPESQLLYADYWTNWSSVKFAQVWNYLYNSRASDFSLVKLDKATNIPSFIVPAPWNYIFWDMDTDWTHIRAVDSNSSPKRLVRIDPATDTILNEITDATATNTFQRVFYLQSIDRVVSNVYVSSTHRLRVLNKTTLATIWTSASLWAFASYVISVGTYIYVICWNNNRVYRLTNTWTIVDFLPSDSSAANNLLTDGNYLYITSGSTPITTIDIQAGAFATVTDIWTVNTLNSFLHSTQTNMVYGSNAANVRKALLTDTAPQKQYTLPASPNKIFAEDITNEDYMRVSTSSTLYKFYIWPNIYSIEAKEQWEQITIISTGTWRDVVSRVVQWEWFSFQEFEREGETTDATPTELDLLSAQTIRTPKLWTLQIETNIVWVRDDGSEVARYKKETIWKDSTPIVYTPVLVHSVEDVFEEVPWWAANHSIDVDWYIWVTVTWEAGKTIKWKAKSRVVSISVE